MNKKICFWILNILTPIICGVAIYLLLGKETYVSRMIFRFLNLRVYSSESILSNNMMLLIRNYACDFLWAYALMFATICVYGKKNSELRKAFVIVVAFEIFIELLQKISLIKGTFDIWDIVIEIFASIIATIIIHDYLRRGIKL